MAYCKLNVKFTETGNWRIWLAVSCSREQARRPLVICGHAQAVSYWSMIKVACEWLAVKMPKLRAVGPCTKSHEPMDSNTD